MEQVAAVHAAPDERAVEFPPLPEPGWQPPSVLAEREKTDPEYSADRESVKRLEAEWQPLNVLEGRRRRRPKFRSLAT